MKQNYYAALLEETPPPPSSPLGSKPQNLAARIHEAQWLSELMRQKRPFCFLRMGDMELAYLLAAQERQFHSLLPDNQAVSGTTPQGNPGIGMSHISRLQQAFEEGDYVDFHERLYPMQHWLPRLHLNRSSNLHQNPNIETSYLSLTWLEHEFKTYCEGRRIGIAGAEARLLELLTQESTWKAAAMPWWPQQSFIAFHQIREDGRRLDENLDLIKQDLSEFISRNQLDTVFLSLGGGAKILCYELSREHEICMFDFGAMLRAFTYSACDGNRAARSTHSPFLFRVPFDIFMQTLERAFLNLTSEELLAKAHAQMLLEVQQKELGWTHTAIEYEFSKENRAIFQAAHQIYLQRYSHLGNSSPVASKERCNFLHFCGKHHLTAEGQAFYTRFVLKSLIRRLIPKISVSTTVL